MPVERVAEAGCLRLGVTHAAHMIRAACQGITLSLLGMHCEDCELTLSTLVRAAMLDAVTVQRGLTSSG